MKTLFLTICSVLVLLCQTAFAQSYIPYYTLVNRALETEYLGNSSLALAQFDSAIAMVPYVHVRTYERAAICALKQGNYPKAYGWIKQAVSQGKGADFWQADAPKAFQRSSYYTLLQDSVHIWEKEAQMRINQPYRALVDSLNYLDQWIVRGVLSAKVGNYQIDKKSLPENRYDLDTAIWNRLLLAIDTWGFPSEQEIGLQGYQNVSIIILHNARMPENESYKGMLKEALLRGEYEPYDYAKMVDQSRLFQKENTFYFVGGKGMEAMLQFSPEERQAIDKRRAEIGVKPLSAYKFKFKKNYSQTKPVW